jgi:hypothetical protein
MSLTPTNAAAGAKGITSSSWAPGARGAGAAILSVGPPPSPSLVSCTLGVAGVWPVFLMVTRTWLALRRSQRPTAGHSSAAGSPLAAAGKSSVAVASATAPVTPPRPSTWTEMSGSAPEPIFCHGRVFQPTRAPRSAAAPVPRMTPPRGMIRIDLGSSGGLSPAGPAASTASMRNDSCALAGPVKIMMLVTSSGLSA